MARRRRWTPRVTPAERTPSTTKQACAPSSFRTHRWHHRDCQSCQRSCRSSQGKGKGRPSRTAGRRRERCRGKAPTRLTRSPLVGKPGRTACRPVMYAHAPARAGCPFRTAGGRRERCKGKARKSSTRSPLVGKRERRACRPVMHAHVPARAGCRTSPHGRRTCRNPATPMLGRRPCATGAACCFYANVHFPRPASVEHWQRELAQWQQQKLWLLHTIGVSRAQRCNFVYGAEKQERTALRLAVAGAALPARFGRHHCEASTIGRHCMLGNSLSTAAPRPLVNTGSWAPWQGAPSDAGLWRRVLRRGHWLGRRSCCTARMMPNRDGSSALVAPEVGPAKNCSSASWSLEAGMAGAVATCDIAAAAAGAAPHGE